MRRVQVDRSPVRGRRSMSGLVASLLVVTVFLGACGSKGEVDDGPVLVQVISLDHAPIRSAVADVLALAEEYGDAVVIEAYSFGSEEGANFAEEKGIDEHLPIAIFINGESKFVIDGRELLFESFPQGAGTGVVADGDWTTEDLRAVLDDETG